MNIQNVPIESITPYPGNPRINASAIATVATSLKAFGWRQPIVVDKDRVIIVGHTRWKAAHSLGMTEVPIHIADNLTPEQAKAYRIMDNKSGEAAEWDFELLKLEMQDLQAVDFPLADTGFALSEIQEIMADEIKGDEDDVPPVPEDPKVRLGELYLLGNHRLLCGDSTKREDVERLMAGQKAGLMNTDPPYGVAYANDERPHPGVAKPRVANDDLSDQKLQAFLESAFSIAASVALLPNAAWYMWHAHLTQGYFAAAAAAAAAKVILHRQIIWVKPVLLLGRGQYHWKHEPCFMGWVKGNQPPDYGLGSGERTQTTIWEVGSITSAERKEFNHSSPKPVGLFDIPMIKHLLPREIAYEPFAGSGPQIISAEKTGRRCFAMEMDPAYCDVILSRWEKATGKMPTLEDGTPWDRVKASRTAQPDIKSDIES
jgi:DNA modification methylase